MASDRHGPVPKTVAPDETRPVEVSGHNSRPLPRRPPPPRNPEPPPASRLSTRERLEAAASRFMDALPEGVGIPSDDDEPPLDQDFDDGPTTPLEIELELEGPAASASDFDEAQTRSFRPPVDGQAEIESMLGIPSDDDSAMFRIKAGQVQRESPVISSAAPPALTEPEHAAVTGRTVVPGAVARRPPPPPASPPPVQTGRTVIPGAVATGGKATPPSMSSLGMRRSTPTPEATEPVDTQEIDLDDIETGDGPVGAAASGVETIEAPADPKQRAPAPSSGPYDAASLAAQADAVPEAAPAPTRVPTPASPAAAAPVAPDELEPPPAAIGDETSPRRGRAGLFIALAAVVLLGAGGVGAWQAGLLDPWLGGATPSATETATVATADAATDDATDVPDPTKTATPPAPGENANPTAQGDDTSAAAAPAAQGETVGNDTDGLAPTTVDAELDSGTDAGTAGSDTDAGTDDPGANDGPPAVAPPSVPPVADASPTLAQARAALTSDPQRAYTLAQKANTTESSDAALEIMATAACATDEGKNARSAFRAMGDAEARRRVTDYCVEKTEINVLAKTNGYTWDEHLRRAQRQYEAKDYEATLESLRQSRKQKRTPESGELLVSVYCAQDNMKKARYMLRRMRPQSKEVAIAECESLGREVGEL